MSECPIELESITVSFPASDGEQPLTIIDDLSFELRSGSSICLAGRSGSGKTSILRVAAAIANPTRGTVRWWGDDVATLDENTIRDLRRTRIGYVDQSSTLVDELTVLENVLLPVLPDGASAVRDATERASGLLDALGLSARADRRSNLLSGGERQRAALSRALLLDPAVLIVDEPTASLDRRWADEVIGVLDEYKRTGGSVLVASHDSAVVAAAGEVVHIEQEPVVARS